MLKNATRLLESSSRALLSTIATYLAQRNNMEKKYIFSYLVHSNMLKHVINGKSKLNMCTSTYFMKHRQKT